MYYLNLDKNGYLLSISTVGSGISIESLDGLDLSGSHINAYRWDGEKLVLDGARLAELIQEEEQEAKEETRQELFVELRATDSVVIEALESLFSATTATGMVSALINAAKNIRTTLNERNNIRKRIKDLGE